MTPLDDLAYFFGGAFLANAIPHLVSGITGRAFQTPFAKPPAVGLSSSTVNVLWAFFNLAVAWVLLLRVGLFDARVFEHAFAAWLGGLAMALLLSRQFGKLHGGLDPER